MRAAGNLQDGTQRAGQFNGAQVLALNVLDQGRESRLGIGQKPHDGGHALQAGMLGRTPAALAGNNFVAGFGVPFACQRPHQHRLNNSLGPYRFRQLGNALGVHGLARLKTSRPQQVQRQFLKLAGGRRLRLARSEQRFKTASQAPVGSGHYSASPRRIISPERAT